MKTQTVLSSYIRFEKRKTEENYRDLLKNFDKIIDSQKIYENLGLKVLKEIKNPDKIIKKLFKDGFSDEKTDKPCLPSSMLPVGFILPVLSAKKLFKVKSGKWNEVLDLDYGQIIKKNDVSSFALSMKCAQKLTNIQISNQLGFGENLYREIDMKAGKYNIYLYSSSIFVLPEEMKTHENMIFKITNKNIEVTQALYIFNSAFLSKNKSDKYRIAGNEVPEHLSKLLWEENFAKGEHVGVKEAELENENIGFCRKTGEKMNFKLGTGKNMIVFISPVLFEKINFFNML